MLALPSPRSSARRRLFCDALKRRRRAVARNIRAFARAAPAPNSSQPFCASAPLSSCSDRHDVVHKSSAPSSPTVSLLDSPSHSSATPRSMIDQVPSVSSPAAAALAAGRDDRRSCVSRDACFARNDDSQPSATAPSLLQFAELDQDVDQLSDMHFSDVDCCEMPPESPSAASAVMVMDPFSSVWVGNEHHFTHFEDMTHLTEEQPLSANAQAVFNVSDRQHQQWTRDAELHNLQFAKGFVDRGLDDIRLYAHTFQQQQQQQQQQQVQLPSSPRQRPC